MESNKFVLRLALCLALLLPASLALNEGPFGSRLPPRRSGQRDECQIQRLNALEPSRRIESEGGLSEFWDENEKEFQCVGVSVVRHVIQPRGLLLPSYSNSPRIAYVVDGEDGVGGLVIPGCPETYQSFQQSSRYEQSQQNPQSGRDEEYQKSGRRQQSPRDEEYQQSGRRQQSPRDEEYQRSGRRQQSPRDEDYQQSGRRQQSPRDEDYQQSGRHQQSTRDEDYQQSGRRQQSPRDEDNNRSGRRQPSSRDEDSQQSGRRQQSPRDEDYQQSGRRQQSPRDEDYQQSGRRQQSPRDEDYQQSGRRQQSPRDEDYQQSGRRQWWERFGGRLSSSRREYQYGSSRREGRHSGRQSESERRPFGGRYQDHEYSHSSSRFEGRYQGDQHQKVQNLRKGDVVAVPAGVPTWFYNNGDRPFVIVVVVDTNNFANQLDNTPRRFFLAGSNPGEQEGGSSQSRHDERHSVRQHQSQTRQRGGGEQQSKSLFGENILSGFDPELLRKALNVNENTVNKLQNPDREKGIIVLAEEELRLAQPTRREQQEEERAGGFDQSRRTRRSIRGSEDENGVEEGICHARFQLNIGNPALSDIYSRQGGHLTSLTSNKLPILNYLQLSVEKGLLHQNAILAPHWTINAHSVIYALRGNARVQIVSNSGNSVFDDKIREGEILVVPQNFAIVKQAEDEEFEWVSFKTNNNAINSPLAGKTSVFRGLPEDVLVNAYQISSEEAKNLKYGREDEVAVLGPSRSQGRASQ